MIGLTDTDKPKETLPILPLRDIVVFPHMIVPLFVGRAQSVRALNGVMKGNKKVLLLTQKKPSVDTPDVKDLFEVGTTGTILQLLKLPDDTVKVLVEGQERVSASDIRINDDNFLVADINDIEDSSPWNEDLEALGKATVAQFEQYVKLNKKIPPEVFTSLQQITEPAKLADTIASHLVLKIEDKQKILEAGDTSERLELIYSFMEGEIGVLQVEKKIRGRVKKQMEKTQREYYLNEQMKAIQKELGDIDGDIDDVTEFETKIAEVKLPEEALTKAKKELKKLKQMSPMAAESTVIRNYLDWLLTIPWGEYTKVKKDLKKARKILDEDHYGLDKVKERILEYLAVQQRSDKVQGSILCLMGPPGVGKTSLGKSIARATNRNFVRMSLGGMRDESEIRGHRRTYIGSMPGKIVQNMKKAKSNNPLFLLDEIDKLGSDYRGDPSSALLEVLDPEQNHTFNDHYLEVDYDLSHAMFICTSNSMDMPQPLLDRMEIINLSGYTEDEKLEIVKRHILKKQVKQAGLKKGEFSINDAAIRHLIRYYTREAGVRGLEREIANLCRKTIKEILTTKKKSVAITLRNIEKYAGVKKARYGLADTEDQVGIVNGLAYTQSGGDLLSIEAVNLPGKDGKVTTTGNLKDVMKESITVAEMLIRSRAIQFGIDYEVLKERQIHVHVPEGAVPKDGPSAGAAMVTAILSSLTNIPIHKDIAMTGEINLRGNVTAIGGLKEKLLGAIRGGIKKVLIPAENVKDLAEIPEKVKKALEIVPVANIDEVLTHALVGVLKPLKHDSVNKNKKISSKTAENGEKTVIHH